MFASLPVTSVGTESEGTLVIPGVGRNVLQLEEDSILEFFVPILPEEHTLSGRVTNVLGTPLENISVLVFSETLTETPEASFGAATRTDSEGRYSLQVLSGIQYRVAFVPAPDSLIGAARR